MLETGSSACFEINNAVQAVPLFVPFLSGIDQIGEPFEMKSGISMLLLLTCLAFETACSSSGGPPQFPERVFNAPWSMDTKSLERLRTSVNPVNVGDDIKHVLDTVGVPDVDHTVEKNEKLRFFYYYATRQRADSPVESDRMVLIALDKHNKVKGICSNVENITNKNCPVRLQ